MKNDKVLDIIEKLADSKDNNPYIVRETLDEIENLVIEEETKKKTYKNQEYLIYGLCVILFFFPIFSFSFLTPLIGFVPLTYLYYKSSKLSDKYKREHSFIRRANIDGLI